MNLNNDILKFFSSTNGQYLHARGKTSTNKLLSILSPKEGDKILEIGTGTGASITLLAKNKTKLNLYGIDASDHMLKKAKQRVKLEKTLNQVEFQKVNGKTIPFPNDFFDKIYIESVLAIQEQHSLEILLIEVHRVLKSGGRLVFNESIWSTTLSKNEIKAINEICLEKFGVIQANELHPFLEDWIQLLSKTGFNLESKTDINKLPSQKINTSLRSKLFTVLGKSKIWFSPTTRKSWKGYNSEMKNVFISGKKYLESYIFDLTKS